MIASMEHMITMVIIVPYILFIEVSVQAKIKIDMLSQKTFLIYVPQSGSLIVNRVLTKCNMKKTKEQLIKNLITLVLVIKIAYCSG